jgi:hypothetical protein
MLILSDRESDFSTIATHIARAMLRKPDGTSVTVRYVHLLWLRKPLPSGMVGVHGQ